GPVTVELYRRWDSEGRLQTRIAVYLSDGEPVEWWAAEGDASTPATDRLRVVGVKLFADGALGSRGAALLEPYSDDPDNRGLLVTDPDTLAAHAIRALELGLQPAIHAIGDRGNRVALEAIERGRLDGDGPPSRIEHAQVIALDDIPRFAELDVIASVQPTHATSDMYWAEDRVGPERIEGAYAWRRLREAGVELACGSDFPVEKANPFHGLYAAVTRQDREGWPEGGWRPEERMTREEAMACFTRDAAAAAGMADEVGSLSVGKRADFLILDRDPMAAPTEEIWTIRVLRTVIGGETVYEEAAR
ncbi:MAG: amidohydrolase family protein, partial [Gemmatimonadetes bacterium]|nr:amidohydrolase family protein [Gemmatimonadota bacterium]